MSVRQIQAAGIIVYRYVDHEPWYLLLQYPSGYWGLCKGKLESGEELRVCALRELAEETAITDVILDDTFEQVFSYRFFDLDGVRTTKTVTFFVGLTGASHVALSKEHLAYQWLPFDQALSQLTYKSTKNLLRQASMHIQRKGV
ncbi:MAG: NUDIX domain-containing protein [Candidatus Babeliales bacterium]